LFADFQQLIYQVTTLFAQNGREGPQQTVNNGAIFPETIRKICAWKVNLY